MKLKALLEDLRVWKQKVVLTQGQLAREQATRMDQTTKIRAIQEENVKYQAELVKLKQERGEDDDQEKAKQVKKKQSEQKEKDEQQKKELMAEMDEHFKSFKK